MDLSQNQSLTNHRLIPCAFHTNKYITNFCKKIQCLLPMCPACVSIHSEQHRQQNTHGQYEGIQEMINSISSLLLQTNKSLEDLSEQYTQDYWNKQKILQSCKQTLFKYKQKFHKQIDKKFSQIEYKLISKIGQFQDNIHDRYKQLQSEIQYLYESISKQREDFDMNNQKILKNVIQFFGQDKQCKIKQWVNKFKQSISDLKRQSIRINCNDQSFFSQLKQLQTYFTFEQFSDSDNQYLISTGRDLLSSTKRKGVQSPRWTDKQNDQAYVQNTVRTTMTFPKPHNFQTQG